MENRLVVKGRKEGIMLSGVEFINPINSLIGYSMIPRWRAGWL